MQLVPEAKPNLFIVADDDQLIFQWNGASPARLRDLRKRFDMQVIQLPENFRCPPDVVALANSLIRHNSDRAADKKPLAAHKAKDAKSRVLVKRFDDFDAERLWLAKRLGELSDDARECCVILARRKKLLEDTIETLTENSIPAYFAVRKNEFQSVPYRWLHATLRLANAPLDREQLRRMTKAFFQLEGIDIDVDDVVARAAVEQAGYLRAWIDMARSRNGVELPTKKLLSETTTSLLDRLDYWKFVTIAHDWFAERRGRPDAEESTFEEFDDERISWDSLKAEIGSHYALTELSLHNFLQELDLRSKEKPAPKGAVRCLTIAASKGTEFSHVFLIGLVEDELPGYHAKKKGDVSDDMREERRNCFVAITRAEETLTLTYSGEYYGYSKAPSRFLAEMGIKSS